MNRLYRQCVEFFIASSNRHSLGADGRWEIDLFGQAQIVSPVDRKPAEENCPHAPASNSCDYRFCEHLAKITSYHLHPIGHQWTTLHYGSPLDTYWKHYNVRVFSVWSTRWFSFRQTAPSTAPEDVMDDVHMHAAGLGGTAEPQSTWTKGKIGFGSAGGFGFLSHFDPSQIEKNDLYSQLLAQINSKLLTLTSPCPELREGRAFQWCNIRDVSMVHQLFDS